MQLPLTEDELGDANRDFASLAVLRERYRGERQEYDFVAPAPTSHVADYAPDPARLRRYAESVIPARIMQLLATSFMKTQLFLDGYLDSVEQGNALVMFMCARSAVEAYAVSSDTLRVIRENAGIGENAFAERVGRVDEALINATYGTRHPSIKALFESQRLSRLRESKPEDAKAVEARNVLTRVDRLAKSDQYPEAREDYDRVSEYLHPNIGQNLILLWPSPVSSKLVRLSVRPREAVAQAARVTARPMARACRGMRDVFQAVEAPFGIGKVGTAESFRGRGA